MSGAFKLATVSRAASPPFVALVLGDRAVALDVALQRFGDAGRPRRRLRVASMLDLLADWEANFDVLRELVAFIGTEGIDSERLRGAVSAVAQLSLHAPVPRPPKMLYAAINYPRPAGKAATRPPPARGRHVREELELRRRPL